MNSLFAAFGALDWKPAMGALLLPPVPWLFTLLLGLWLRYQRRWMSISLVVISILALWFSHCRVTGDWLQQHVLGPPAEINPADLGKLKRSLAGRKPVVLVLGGGVEVFAPEYGEAQLNDQSLQRLHYGLWLARKLDLPVMFSGGAGRSQRAAVAEATVAARTAERDYGRSVRWQETKSADTRGNARASLPILSAEGYTDVLLVSHQWHMPRALRAFREAADIAGSNLRLMPAVMGCAISSDQAVLDWMPSVEGYRLVRNVVREALGMLAGA